MTRMIRGEHMNADEPLSSPARPRMDCIDMVRGLVIVIMALDHVKGNFSNAHFDFTDLTRTDAAHFLTRWITHFCAPTFVFLAGTGAFLFRARGRSKGELSWFLLSRGLWLVLLEVTVIRHSWFLELSYTFSFGQVIWAIGWSMVIMSGLIFLPTTAITALGVAMIVLHNLWDAVPASQFGQLDWLWKILHTGEMIELAPARIGDTGRDFAIPVMVGGPLSPLLTWVHLKIEPAKLFSPFYPLIPWIGVMAAGYGFGAFMQLPQKVRRAQVFGLGCVLVLTFLVLRYGNLYGDKMTAQEGGPGPWSAQATNLFTVFSYCNCQKYPPSLLYLLMTLGPAIMAIAIFDHETGLVGKFFVTFGRVPLFFYLLHWYAIQALAIGLSYARYGRADWLIGQPRAPRPEDYGYDLPVVYLLWAGVVLFLFPLCYWFAGVKRRSRAAWLSYL